MKLTEDGETSDGLVTIFFIRFILVLDFDMFYTIETLYYDTSYLFIYQLINFDVCMVCFVTGKKENIRKM